MMKLFECREDLEKGVREELFSLRLRRGNFIRLILNKYKEQINVAKEEILFLKE